MTFLADAPGGLAEHGIRWVDRPGQHTIELYNLNSGPPH